MMKMILTFPILLILLIGNIGCTTTGTVDWPRVCNEIDGATAVATDYQALTEPQSKEHEALGQVIKYGNQASQVACAVADVDQADKRARVTALLNEGLRIADELIDDLADEERKRQAQLALIVIRMGLRRAGFQLE